VPKWQHCCPVRDPTIWQVGSLVYNLELRELELRRDMLKRLLLQSVSERNQARVRDELGIVAAKIKLLEAAASKDDESHEVKPAA
jgi:hypothetical protein